MKTARLPFIIIIIILGSLLAFLNTPSTDNDKKKIKSATKVYVQSVEIKKFKDMIEALGTTKANEAVTLHTQYSAHVKSIHFSGGDDVKKGSILVTLNSEEESAEVRELEANLAEAKRQLERFKGLQESKSASQSVVDEQRGEVEAIYAQLEQAQAKLAKYQIRAPFDGVLGTRNISVGAFLSDNTPITTLDDLSVIKVDFTIPEKDFTKVHLGQEIEARSVAYSSNVFTGKVANIDSRLNPVTRSILVRAHIDNSDKKLKPGMLLSLMLLRSTDDIILISEGALIPKKDKQWVYRVVDNTAQQVEVKTGRRRAGIVEILDGLSINDKVITEGALKVRNGSPVTAIEEKE